MLVFTGIYLSAPSFAQEGADSSFVRCATDEMIKRKSEKSAPYRALRIKTEQAIQDYVQNNGGRLRKAAGEVIRIPVVVHIIHNQQDNRIGGSDNPNLSEEQIRSQIVVLNEDYRKKEGTNGYNTNAVGTDTQIEFELAQYDPDGHNTNGITRNYVTQTTFNPYTDDQVLAGIVSWPSDKYLNIWVCALGTAYLGVAQLPSVEGIDGLDNSKSAEAATDGVIINYKVFGSVQHLSGTGSITSTVYNLGRTTTHEIGHWLGLLHTWGSQDNFCGTDYCNDTPQARAGNLSFDCTPKYVTCSGRTTQVMIENYMDYSPDGCMNIFTADQLARMQAAIALSPRRIKLIENAKAGRLDPADQLTVDVFPNPASENVYANVRFKDFQSFSVTIYDQKGIVRSVTQFTDVWSRKIAINTRNLAPGLYICRVSTGTESVTRRFLFR